MFHDTTGPAECLKKLWRQWSNLIDAGDIKVTDIPNVPYFDSQLKILAAKIHIWETIMQIRFFPFFSNFNSLLRKFDDYIHKLSPNIYIYYLLSGRKLKSNVWQIHLKFSSLDICYFKMTIVWHHFEWFWNLKSYLLHKIIKKID